MTTLISQRMRQALHITRDGPSVGLLSSDDTLFFTRRGPRVAHHHSDHVELCIEVELRFNANIARLESELNDGVDVFSEKKERVCTLVDVMKHIQGNVGHSLINEAELPGDELQISAPHIYCTPD
ncbi:uncharacterized protein LOC119404353 [Rhipicephalus sanguineus]|uniref:uncharacterized protein LOC119404353 n=1 Tax=Rhipicephalus sanguineus TaxID=34632 RepID=UPI001894DE6C|nr:uncharacterized protein LOC119404353 [Rhipicephalus sanguineus]